MFVAYIVGVRSVYGGHLQRIQLVSVCYITSNILRNVLQIIMKCVAYIPRMVGVHSVRRRGRFISPVYEFYWFVGDYSLCSCMFVVVS